MNTQRRLFLKTIFGVSAGVMLPRLVSASAKPLLAGNLATSEHSSPRSIPQVQICDPLAQASYLPHLNTQFQIQSGQYGKVPVRLVEVLSPEPDAPHFAPRATEQFSLLFEGAPDTLLTQDTHTLSHPNMGTFDLFLVPVGDSQKSALYQAIIHCH